MCRRGGLGTQAPEGQIQHSRFFPPFSQGFPGWGRGGSLFGPVRKARSSYFVKTPLNVNAQNVIPSKWGLGSLTVYEYPFYKTTGGAARLLPSPGGSTRCWLVSRTQETAGQLSARIQLALAAAQALDAILLIGGNLTRQRHLLADDQVRDRCEYRAAIPVPKDELADNTGLVTGRSCAGFHCTSAPA